MIPDSHSVIQGLIIFEDEGSSIVGYLIQNTAGIEPRQLIESWQAGSLPKDTAYRINWEGLCQTASFHVTMGPVAALRYVRVYGSLVASHDPKAAQEFDRVEQVDIYRKSYNELLQSIRQEDIIMRFRAMRESAMNEPYLDEASRQRIIDRWTLSD